MDGFAGSLDFGYLDCDAAADGDGRGGPGRLPTGSVNDPTAAHEQRRGAEA